MGRASSRQQTVVLSLHPQVENSIPPILGSFWKVLVLLPRSNYLPKTQDGNLGWHRERWVQAPSPCHVSILGPKPPRLCTQSPLETLPVLPPVEKGAPHSASVQQLLNMQITSVVGSQVPLPGTGIPTQTDSELVWPCS